MFLIKLIKELSESIRQCNYFIYQELIYFQSNNNRINDFLSYRGDNITRSNYYQELYNRSLIDEDNNRKSDVDSSKYKEDIRQDCVMIIYECIKRYDMNSEASFYTYTKLSLQRKISLEILICPKHGHLCSGGVDDMEVIILPTDGDKVIFQH